MSDYSDFVSPNSDLITTDWTVTGTTYFWDALNESLWFEDGDTSYARAATGTGSLILGYSGYSIPENATNITITVALRIRQEAFNSLRVCGVLRIGGTNYNSSPCSSLSSTSWQEAGVGIFSVNPVDSSEWTVEAINSIQGFGIYGYYSNPAGSYFRCTRANLWVNYDLIIPDKTVVTTDGSSIVGFPADYMMT